MQPRPTLAPNITKSSAIQGTSKALERGAWHAQGKKGGNATEHQPYMDGLMETVLKAIY